MQENHENIICSLKKGVNSEKSILEMISGINDKQQQQNASSTQTIKEKFNQSISELKKITNEKANELSSSNTIQTLHSIAALLAKYKQELLISEEFSKLSAENKQEVYNGLFGASTEYAKLYDQYYSENGIYNKLIKPDIDAQLKNIFGEQGQGMEFVFQSSDQNQIKERLDKKNFDDNDITYFKDLNTKLGKENKQSTINLQVKMKDRVSEALYAMTLKSDPRSIGMLAALGDANGIEFSDAKRTKRKYSAKAVGKTVLHAIVAATFIAASAAVLYFAAVLAIGASALVGVGIKVGAIAAEKGLYALKDKVMGSEVNDSAVASSITSSTAAVEGDTTKNSFSKAMSSQEIKQMIDYITIPLHTDKVEQQANALKNANSDKLNPIEKNLLILSESIKAVGEKIKMTEKDIIKGHDIKNLMLPGQETMKMTGIQFGNIGQQLA